MTTASSKASVRSTSRD